MPALPSYAAASIPVVRPPIVQQMKGGAAWDRHSFSWEWNRVSTLGEWRPQPWADILELELQSRWETSWHLLFESNVGTELSVRPTQPSDQLSPSVSPQSPVDTTDPTFRTSNPLISPPKQNDNTAALTRLTVSPVSQVIKHRLNHVD